MQMDGTLIQTLGENKEQELEKIIRCITLVHLQQTPHTPEFFEKLPQREKEFMVFCIALITCSSSFCFQDINRLELLLFLSG